MFIVTPTSQPDQSTLARSETSDAIQIEHNNVQPAKAKSSRRENLAEDSERLQKLLARAGIASRRAAEEIIRAGRVSVNGHVITELGFKADAVQDRIVVDGHPLRLPSGPGTVLLMHKPRGVVTTKDDPEGRQTVMQLLPREFATLHPIGRLDYDTAGLLLLTDDGDLTQLLTHPSHGVEKVYQARVRGVVTVATIKKLEGGIRLEDGPTLPCRVRVRAQTFNNALIEIALREGRNRQVRRMLEAIGHPVSSLRRVKFGGLDLLGVTVGSYRVLLPGEVHALRKSAGSKAKAKPKNSAPTKTKSRPKVLSDVVAAAHTSATRSTSPRGKSKSAPPRLGGPQSVGSRLEPSYSRASGAADKPMGSKPSRTPRPSKATPKSEAAVAAARTSTPTTVPKNAAPKNATSKNATSKPYSSARATAAPAAKGAFNANRTLRDTAARGTSDAAPPRGRNTAAPRDAETSRAAGASSRASGKAARARKPALAQRIQDRWK